MMHLLNTLLIIVVTGLWVVYAYFEGVREAYYYHATNMLPSQHQPELHPLFTWQRVLVVFFIAICLSPIKPISLSFVVVGCAFIFTYIHDGSYYLWRNKLDVNTYPLKWKDSSTTSTAKTELNYMGRLIFFIIGLAFIISALIIFYIKLK